jgi:predicted nucleic acid-binding protein
MGTLLSVYFDTSVLVALFTDNPFSNRAQTAFRGRRIGLTSSDFAAAEFASAVSRHVRMRELSIRDAREALADFDIWQARMALRVESTPADVRAAEAMLRRLNLPLRTPDAIHIAIAQRIGAELATFDVKLAESARALGTQISAI